jgi:hypothetical protein
MAKEIPLSQGRFATVDDEDYDWLSEYRWSYSPAHTGYAERGEANSKKHIKMHREIMDRYGHNIKGMSVDHIDGNTLNNTKANLRVCTHAQNLRNQRLSTNNTSGYKGVSLACNGKWLASISVDSKRIGYGTYEDIYSAVTIYNLAALYHHGEFARFNKLPSCITVNPLYIKLPKTPSVAERVRELLTATVPGYSGQLGTWETLAEHYFEIHEARRAGRNRKVLQFPSPVSLASPTRPAPIEEKAS